MGEASGTNPCWNWSKRLPQDSFYLFLYAPSIQGDPCSTCKCRGHCRHAAGGPASRTAPVGYRCGCRRGGRGGCHGRVGGAASGEYRARAIHKGDAEAKHRQARGVLAGGCRSSGLRSALRLSKQSFTHLFFMTQVAEPARTFFCPEKEALVASASSAPIAFFDFKLKE